MRLNQAVANKLISSVDYLRESFVGTLERCLNSLEKSNYDSSVHNVTSNHLKQVGRSLLKIKWDLFVSMQRSENITLVCWVKNLEGEKLRMRQLGMLQFLE